MSRSGADHRVLQVDTPTANPVMTRSHDIQNTANASHHPDQPVGPRAALDPDIMTPRERIREVGGILAAGILRLRDRESDGTPRSSRR